MKPTHRATPITPELYEYLLDHGEPPDEVALDLIEATSSLPAAGMQIGSDQAAFMAMMVRLTGARRVVEVGTFTGYSSLSMARALPEDGHLLCCDVSEEWTSLARRAWAQAGVEDRIELVLAPAAETLAALAPDPVIDLSFIDADKSGYQTYYDELLPRTRTGGVLLVDNVLWGGRVVDASDQSADTVAIRAFNDAVVADDRVEVVMLAVSDGLTLVTRRR